MAELHLSEDDLTRLAMSLAPLLIPSMRAYLAETAARLVERFGVGPLLDGEIETDVLLGAVHELFTAAEERRFSSIQPVAIGTVKGTS
ncbi:hypothetical protein SEA_VANLEE_38 [Gordonia phage VanLee]|uniref:Uncharacterized protein n=1 Tax=Gordonia phage VanLee TaxID=2845816 RepID=A0A8F2D9D0_9CAUD|nr:hypothetical protein QEH49_gp038 [Gordonia phage VanLee]QWS68155.1 hypothetical protein SEA_VANLEE_38 [Gordonia phage VanLee]